MINVTNRILNIPFNQRTIAIDGDNKTDVEQFRIDGLDYADYDFVIDTKIGNTQSKPI